MFKKLLPWYLVALVVLSLAFIYGCGNATGGGGGGGGGGASMVKLTGHITAESGYNILDLPTISRVVIFNCDGGYWIASVEGGVFTGEAEAGRPVGLIFADSVNQFIGYLTMGSSIDSIPLNLVSSSINEIDLETLIINAGIATSENPFIDDKLISEISTFDVAAMAFGNELFSSIIKHPDADGNGQVDILEDPTRYYRPFFRYTVAGGNFSPLSGPGLVGIATGDAGTSADITNNNFCLDVSDKGGDTGSPMPNSITVYYPDGTFFTATATSDYGTMYSSTRRLYDIDPGGLGTLEAPPDGTYEVSYNLKILTFEVAGQTATQELALMVPTVTVNSSGSLEKINWVYKLGGGSGGEMMKPGSLVEVAQIIIWGDDTTQLCATGFTLTPTTKEYTLSPKIPWNSIASINMIYNDFYGNPITASWNNLDKI